MLQFLHGLLQKITIGVMIALAGISGRTIQIQAPASQTAIIASARMPAPAFVTSTPATITSPATSTVTIAKKVVTPPKVLPVAPIPPATIAITNSTPTPLTAQQFLADTTISLTQGLDSSERVTFVTNAGGAEKISWNLLNTTVGGSGSVPSFAVVSSCTPPPTAPMPDDLNQNPLLSVRTSYDCTVTLTPLSGTNRVAVSKDFTFETDPGQLVASVAAETDSLLQDDTNNGGFTFDNQDTQPVTITGLTVDVSFTGVATSNLLVLRFADPTTGASLYDDPLGNSAGSQTGISVPLSFMIPANTQKVLPVEAIGVSILAVNGTSPTITVTLRGITTNDNAQTKFISPQISWTCIVPTAAYDPYATSSAFMTGQACGN